MQLVEGGSVPRKVSILGFQFTIHTNQADIHFEPLWSSENEDHRTDSHCFYTHISSPKNFFPSCIPSFLPARLASYFLSPPVTNVSEYLFFPGSPVT